MSAVLASRGIDQRLDDWGPDGGHDWPSWHHQMWEYVGTNF
jgi:esterase/lipase superfamily enzyme